jgi:DNA-binding transcriptional LysR family regulator
MRESLMSLDLHHLSLLNHLLSERSVTRVAEQLGQAQPAVSRSLRRLREVLADPLLVRSGTKMVLTERAEALRRPLSEILAQLAHMETRSAFDPSSADREFSIACADCLPPEFLPRIIAALTSAGPRVRVRTRQIDPHFYVGEALESGSLDLVINNSPKPREDLRLGALFSDEVVCLMRAGHPMAQQPRIELAPYLGLQHLAPHPSSLRELGPVDGELAKVGYRRTIAATVPEFNLVPYVLLRTDLVFTTGRRFAEHYAQRMDLAVVPAPAVFPDMRFYQLWHERNHGSRSNQWLRERVKEASA